MSIEVQEVSATLTIDASQAFSMQGMFTSVYNNLPPGYQVTGVAFPMMGMSCQTSGVMDTYSDIKDSCMRLYNYVMKAYLEPIWDTLNDILRFLENAVGKLFNGSTALPVLNLQISDLFSDNLYETLDTSVTNLYNTDQSALKTLLNALGIPFESFTSQQSSSVDIKNITMNVLTSLWTFFYNIVNDIMDAIKAGLTAYDYLTNPTGPTPGYWSTIWNAAINGIESWIQTVIAAGGPTIQTIQDLITDAAKAAYHTTEVTLQQIMSWISNFTMTNFGKPFDWTLPLNPGVDSPWKDFNQILSSIKLWLSNFLGAVLQVFMSAINQIVSLCGGSLSIPVLKIHYTVCAQPVNAT
jgi:phage-related protein